MSEPLTDKQVDAIVDELNAMAIETGERLAVNHIVDANKMVDPNPDHWTQNEEALKAVRKCGRKIGEQIGANMNKAVHDFIVTDSGQREQFAAGAQRDTREGKGRFDLIWPGMLKRLALHMERGAAKYNDHNWTKGIPSSRFMDSLLRHANRYSARERTEDHMAAVIFNAMGIMFNEDVRTDFHDLFDWGK